MAKKSRLIVLEKLKGESSSQLDTMLAELTGVPARGSVKPVQRKRRFIASGKFQMQ
jgi:hypothetical protein